eukprot:1468690-Prymnesium_polylepis.1
MKSARHAFASWNCVISGETPCELVQTPSRTFANPVVVAFSLVLACVGCARTHGLKPWVVICVV